jgi:penicillin-binding protein 1A
MESLYSDLPPVNVGGRRLVGRVVFALLVVAAAVLGALGGLLFVYSTDLPQVGDLERYRPSTTTELYDDQGRVIGTFALQRRVIAGYEDFPPVLRDAVLSIEDKDFEKHWGVNFWRAAGVAWKNLSSDRLQGASTLTMQLSRNLFLSQEQTMTRKVQEVMLAIQIERRFTKPQIFTLYANQIYLGHGVYGFEAGAQYYFSKRAKELTLEEAALLAALPKAPNGYSPISNPDKALRRRNLVLDNLVEDGKITAAEARQAKELPIRLNLQAPRNTLAPYFAEEVRQYLEKKYGSDQVHEGGLRVYTTLNVEMQRTANQAVLDGLAAFERRHGWRGGLRNLGAAGLEGYRHADWELPLEPGRYVHALVTAVTPAAVTVKLGKNTSAQLLPADAQWTGRRLNEVLKVGDVAYVKVAAIGADGKLDITLEQASAVQGALLAIENSTGDVKAMVGGKSFEESKFNRATQALRQVGSSFKPYVYTTAIDNGVEPDDVIIDAPTAFPSASGPYIPRNYDGKFEGAITVRRAIAQSRNIPALKLAERMTIRKVIDYAHKFGITSDIPPYLPVALGSAEVTLLEQVAAFTTFPNDGVRVSPRYIRKVTDYDGRVLEENFPEVRDVVSARTARIMTTLLQGVVQQGTATRAKALKHPLGGKTGTTNDFTDAWFIGFSPSITCGVWIGYDEKKMLGKKETGGLTALPVWIDFMKVALHGREGEQFPVSDEPPDNAALARRLDTPDHAPGDPEAH